MSHEILSSRARIQSAQAKKLLKSYAERLSPRDAAKSCKLSLNTVYLQYDRIRWRLILSRYYQNGALSFDEDGLAPGVKDRLKQRRGIAESDIYPHAAELIEWAEEWSPRLVLKHLNKIIALTGPLDVEPALSEVQTARLHAYVRYARVELIHERCNAEPKPDQAQQEFVARIEITLDRTWRAYRTASKRVERSSR